MLKPNVIVNRPIWKYTGYEIIPTEDTIVSEYPLTIVINGDEWATLVCTPDHLHELITGFLASEGIVLFPQKEIKSINIDEEEGFAYIELHHKPDIRNIQTKRYIGSCCGNSRQDFYFEHDVKAAKTSLSEVTLQAEQCLQLMKDMHALSSVFQQTGGVHNAAVCSPEKLLLSRTDIGRHNALDKLYGYCLMEGVSMQDKIITFSGRISSEILLKAAKIGVGIVLSKSAPTGLAISMAEELNITTVGFIRHDQFNIYSHPHRMTI